MGAWLKSTWLLYSLGPWEAATVLFQVPAMLRPFVQLLAWCWVIVLPGMSLAALVLRGRRGETGGTLALVAGSGLMAVPAAAHGYVSFTGSYLPLWFLLSAAGVVNAGAAALWTQGLRLRIEKPPLVFAVGLAAVALVAFFTYDPWLLFSNIDEYVAVGAGDCFRRGTFRYIGFWSPAFPDPEPPMGPFWDGVIRGNVALSATYVHLFGTVGFRFLRMTVMLLLGLLGWALGKRVGGTRGAVAGMLLFALNPYVVMCHELDRNVLALAWAAMLYFLVEEKLAGPVVLGLTAGFASGVGLNLLPLLFLLPMALTLRLVHRWDVTRLALVGGIAVVCAGAWLTTVGLPPMLPSLQESRGDGPGGKPLGQQFPGPESALPGQDFGDDMEAGGPDSGPDGGHGPIWGRAPEASDPPRPFAYSVLGLTVHMDRALAFPFRSNIIRSATDPYPPALYYLLDMGQTLGALLLALAAVGFVAMFRRDRRRALILVLWGFPTYGVLALQAYLLQPEQLRIFINGLLPLLLLPLYALDWLMDAGRTRPRLFLVGAVAGVLIAFFAGAAHLDFPQDERVNETMLRQVKGKENPEGFVSLDLSVEEMRQRYRVPGIVPNYRDRHVTSRLIKEVLGRDSRWLDFGTPDLWSFGGVWLPPRHIDKRSIKSFEELKPAQ